MIGVALVAVYNTKGINHSCLKIHHLQVGLRVPDRESTIVGHGIEQEPAVRTDAWMTDGALRTLWRCCNSQRIYFSTDRAAFLIKGNTA